MHKTCVCICVVYKHVYVGMYVSMCACLCIYICIYLCVYIYICISVCVIPVRLAPAPLLPFPPIKNMYVSMLSMYVHNPSTWKCWILLVSERTRH